MIVVVAIIIIIKHLAIVLFASAVAKPRFEIPYQSVFEDHVTKPLEVQSFKGRKDKERLGLIAFCLLDGSLRISDPHGGFGADIFLIAFHWGFI